MLSLRATFPILALLGTLPAQTLALKGLDPVALCQGKEEAGKPDLTVTEGDYRYQFASAASRTQFLADPRRFGIQLGGACARMGPTSGQGDPQRWHVHNERVYIFASDQCREGFKKRGDALLDVDEPRPTPDAAASRAAAELLARAATAHGGKERLVAMRSYTQQHSVTKGAQTESTRVAVQWPAAVRIDLDSRQDTQSWHHARVLAGEQGFFVDSGKGRNMSAEARLDVQRSLGHEPLLALRAALDGASVVTATGKRDGLGGAVEELAVWQHGRTTWLGCDAAGRVVTARFRGRGPSLAFGAVELRFDGFETKGGIVVPTTIRGTFDGKDEPSFTQTRTGVAIDPELSADLFARPKQ